MISGIALCLVIKVFIPRQKEAVYQRFYRLGRQLPDGLHYVDSWLDQSRAEEVVGNEGVSEDSRQDWRIS